MKTNLAIIVLLVGLTLVVFGQVTRFEFINMDDEIYVAANEHLTGGLTLRGIAWAFTTFHNCFYHPLVWVSYMLDRQFYGTEPFGYHLTNLILHLLSTIALFLALSRMTGHPWRSGFVAALFAVHPLHVESVAWVAERKDVLSAFFWMLTMYAYVRYVEHPSIARYLPVLLTFALGLLSKPMLVTLPFVLLLLDWWPLGRTGKTRRRGDVATQGAEALTNGGDGERIKGGSELPLPCCEAATGEGRGEGSVPPKPTTPSAPSGACIEGQVPNIVPGNLQRCAPSRLLLEKAPLLLLAAVSSILSYIAQSQGEALATSDQYPVGVRVANMMVAYVTYMWKTFWPAKLAAFYPHPGNALPAWQVILSAGILVTVTILALWKARRLPYLAVGWLWFAGTLVPVSGIVQFGAHAMADRFTYIPLVGLFVAIAWGMPDLLSRQPSAISHQPPTICHFVSPPPPSPPLPLAVGYAVNVLAVFSILVCSLLSYTQVGYWRSSVTLFSHAIRVTHGNYLAHNNLAAALEKVGRVDEAIGHYRAALRIAPRLARAHNNLGNIYLGQGKYRDADNEYRMALSIRPWDAEIRSNLATALAGQGRLDEAIGEYREAIRRKPGLTGARLNLAEVLMLRGRNADAAAEYQTIIRLDPSCAEAKQALAGLRYNKNRGRP